MKHLLLVQIKCKCGKLVLCKLSENNKDGDLINHSGCKASKLIKLKVNSNERNTTGKPQHQP